MINRNSKSFHPFLGWQIVKFDAGVLDSRLYFFNVIPKLNSPFHPRGVVDTSPTLSTQATQERDLESRPSTPSPPTHTTRHIHIPRIGVWTRGQGGRKAAGPKAIVCARASTLHFPDLRRRNFPFRSFVFRQQSGMGSIGVREAGSLWPISFSQTSTTVSDG
jgi:hypothetical protein